MGLERLRIFVSSPGDVSEERVLYDSLAKSGRMSASDAEGHQLPAGDNARRYIGEMNRTAFAAAEPPSAEAINPMEGGLVRFGIAGVSVSGLNGRPAVGGGATTGDGATTVIVTRACADVP